MKLPKDLYKKHDIVPVRIFITPRGHIYHKIGRPNLSVFTVEPDNPEDFSIWEKPMYPTEIPSKVEQQINLFKAEREQFAFGPHPFYTHKKTEDRLADLEYKVQLLQGRVL